MLNAMTPLAQADDLLNHIQKMLNHAFAACLIAAASLTSSAAGAGL